MLQPIINKHKCLRGRAGGQCDRVGSNSHDEGRQPGRLRGRRSSFVVGLILAAILTSQVPAQSQPPIPVNVVKPDIVSLQKTTTVSQQKAPATPAKRPITITEAVAIFLQQNLQLVAARYDIDTADAEKLTARLRPNPEINVGLSDIPLEFSRNLVTPQTFSYGISQTIELGGKRQKRMDAANADAEVARAGFQVVVWQMTTDVKKKFYSVVLAKSLFDLAKENQTTFAEIVDHTTDVFKSGEISGLDLQRLEIEKLKFDTDLANTERDYEVALRDLRFALGGDYRAMDIEAAGAVDYYQEYDFSPADLRDKAMAARPDLKAAQLSETAANAAIRLQNAQRIPDITVGAGIEQIPSGGSTYNVGVSIPLPVSNRNQGERAKALIQKQKALNDQQLIANQVLSDVDKAYVAFEIQRRRIELYRTGVLKKVNDIQTMTEFSLKAGESSILELLDAIRTRRDTLAGFYQTLFDYQMSLLDLELATATPLQK
jgi:cobalt-zinc-cadmium efflux system outer membrane protein